MRIQCTISSYTGCAARDDRPGVMLGLHHNAELHVSPAALVSAADDDDFLDFSHDDMFLINGGPDLPRERTGSISSVDRRRSSLHITSTLRDLS